MSDHPPQAEDLREIRADVKKILHQMPSDESIKTEQQCANDRRAIVYIVEGLAAAMLALAGWVFYLATTIGGQ